MTTDAPSSSSRDRIMVLVAAILFSTGGAAVKACSLTGWQVACFRSAVAVIAIYALVPVARRGWTLRIWAVGLAYGATMIFYVLANKLTTAANAIFLQSSAPMYVLLLSPWLLSERIRPRQLVFMATLAVGMVCFFIGSQPTSSTATDPVLGNVLGACSGLTFALCIMGLRRLGRDEVGVGASSAAVCCGSLIACLTTLPMAFPVQHATSTDWEIVVFLGVFQIGIAYAFLVRGIARVPAIETSLILLAEPVLNPVWAWAIHGEVPTAWALAGGAIILGATAVMAMTGARD
jgi:DME family drug/metabolite transporter